MTDPAHPAANAPRPPARPAARRPPARAVPRRAPARRVPARRLSLAAALLALLAVAGCGPVGGDSASSHRTRAVGLGAVSGGSADARGSGEVTLAFAGDVHFTERTAKLLDDPSTAFGPVSAVLSAADIAMVNLETAVTTRGTPEPKQFHFRAPPSAFEAVRAAGVDLVTIANNHILDYGRTGLSDTLAAARAARFPVVGAGADARAAYAPYVADVRGTRVAFLAVSQIHELESSWKATATRSGMATASDVARAVAAVRAARRQADVVVVYVHWGHEGSPCPTGEMRSFARAMADAGADVVVGTHAHLLLGDGYLGRTYVQYGLGNFLWWWDDAFSNDTGVLQVTLRGRAVQRVRFVPAEISRTTGQPVPATGAEASRISAKYAGLRGCTGLAAHPTAPAG